VLPGCTLANSALHQCRAVCRRAEREILRLSREEPIDARLIKYINRLSDFFFVMSRYASRKARVKEYLWEYGLSVSAGKKAEAKSEAKSEANPASPAPGKKLSAKRR
jgi:cob(I)alamin adenosyltransferase